MRTTHCQVSRVGNGASARTSLAVSAASALAAKYGCAVAANFFGSQPLSTA